MYMITFSIVALLQQSAGFGAVVVATWNIWALQENVKAGDSSILQGSITIGEHWQHLLLTVHH